MQTGRQTYPAFVCDSEDTLHLITRQWRRGVDSYHDGAGYGALVHQSLPAGGAWSEPSLIVVGADPGYCIYYHKLALDARDRLFLSTSYQGGPDLRSERALTSTLAFLGRSRLRPGKYRRRMLLVSEDGGTSWRFATDADLDVPAAGERPAARSAQAASGPWDDRTAVVPNKLAWQWLNPQPQGNQFTGVAFGDRRSGWAVGTHGPCSIPATAASTGRRRRRARPPTFTASPRRGRTAPGRSARPAPSSARPTAAVPGYDRRAGPIPLCSASAR